MTQILYNMEVKLFFLIFLLPLMGKCQERSFEIDYENDTYLMDGNPFRYISGSMHYFRVLPELWMDRMMKIRAAGFNTLQFYVQWSLHEPTPGSYTFEGGLDFEAYIEMAQSLGFYVIFRPGPYTCGERDGGGLPYWLYQLHPDIQMRSSDPTYLSYVDQWWGVLLPRVRKYLYQNGGPIILVQMENEYGSFGVQTGTCDHDYMSHLVQLANQHLGEEAVLFTTDPAYIDHLQCGKVDGAYATIDFGVAWNVTNAFAVQRMIEPRGPLVNSEYYPGWFDYWGKPHGTVAISDTVKILDEVLAAGASINIYMAHGGTSFGFGAGANTPPFQTMITSYDYDALITESGDLTEKYFACKDVIAKYVDIPDIPVDETPFKTAYGIVDMTFVSTLFDAGDEILTFRMNSTDVKTFEDLDQASGFVLYETTIDQLMSDPSELKISGLHDRGYIFVNQEPRGILSRSDDLLSTPISVRVGDRLQILVENQGRINYGPDIKDFKGITSSVILGATTLHNWSMFGMPLDDGNILERFVQDTVNNPDVKARARKGIEATGGQASFWTGDLIIPCDQGESVTDTFLKLPGWSKGVAFVNGFNLGKYWPIVGPQVTLYVPAPLLKCERNTLLLLELEYPGCDRDTVDENSICLVNFVDQPEIDGPTPSDGRVAEKQSSSYPRR